MYTQEIWLPTNLTTDKEILYNEFFLLLTEYYENGQVQDGTDNLHFDSDNIRGFPLTIAKDALNKKYNTPLINERIKKIETLANSKLQFKILGELPLNTDKECKCKKTTFYILYTTFTNLGSPITCGTCNLNVPLYKLPLFNQYGYGPILKWESNYQSCDRLNMNCAVGEVWAMKQMWRADSQLSKQGIDICKKLTELTNTPTFYYLFNYRSIRHSKDIKRKCPCCGGEWLLQEKLHNIFDFKCDNCNLISSLSDNSY